MFSSVFFLVFSRQIARYHPRKKQKNIGNLITKKCKKILKIYPQKYIDLKTEKYHQKKPTNLTRVKLRQTFNHYPVF